MSKTKLRFKQDGDRADVLAKRRTTGKWEKIGVCHSASIPILKESIERMAELVKFTLS